MTITFTIPVEIVSEANRRDHWRVKAKRVEKQKKAAIKFCEMAMGKNDCPIPGSFRITLARIMGKRQRPYDDDNLRSAFKAIRDGIADYLGINDGSDRLKWEYAQEKGILGEVRVEIERMEAGNGE